MSMQDTSLLAYFGEVVHKLGVKQKEVLECLRFNGPMTNSEIANKLKRPINTITPRCKELRDRKLVVEAGNVSCSITGRTAKLWRAVAVDRKPAQRELLEIKSRQDSIWLNT